jgi:hypothetical protein
MSKLQTAQRACAPQGQESLTRVYPGFTLGIGVKPRLALKGLVHQSNEIVRAPESRNARINPKHSVRQTRHYAISKMPDIRLGR